MFGRYPVVLFYAVSAAAAVCGLVFLGFSIFAKAPGLSVSLNAALRLLLIPPGLIYGTLFVLTLFTLLADRRYIKIPFAEKLAVQFFNPLYMLGYARIYIAALFTSYDYFKWEPTDRVPFEAKAADNTGEPADIGDEPPDKRIEVNGEENNEPRGEDTADGQIKD
jgi:hypothetical protein